MNDIPKEIKDKLKFELHGVQLPAWMKWSGDENVWVHYVDSGNEVIYSRKKGYTYTGGDAENFTPIQEKDELRACDLAGWWCTWGTLLSINQITSFSKNKEKFCVSGEFLEIKDPGITFSKDPTTPISEWLTIDQVAESLDKKIIDQAIKKEYTECNTVSCEWQWKDKE